MGSAEEIGEGIMHLGNVQQRTFQPVAVLLHIDVVVGLPAEEHEQRVRGGFGSNGKIGDRLAGRRGNR